MFFVSGYCPSAATSMNFRKLAAHTKRHSPYKIQTHCYSNKKVVAERKCTGTSYLAASWLLRLRAYVFCFWLLPICSNVNELLQTSEVCVRCEVCVRALRVCVFLCVDGAWMRVFQSPFSFCTSALARLTSTWSCRVDAWRNASHNKRKHNTWDCFSASPTLWMIRSAEVCFVITQYLGQDLSRPRPFQTTSSGPAEWTKERESIKPAAANTLQDRPYLTQPRPGRSLWVALLEVCSLRPIWCFLSSLFILLALMMCGAPRKALAEVLYYVGLPKEQIYAKNLVTPPNLFNMNSSLFHTLGHIGLHAFCA